MGTLPEWLTGSPAKRLCIARVSSNLTGVDFLFPHSISIALPPLTFNPCHLDTYQSIFTENGCSLHPARIQTACNVPVSSHLALEFTVFGTFLPGFFAPRTPCTPRVSGESAFTVL